MNHPLVGKEIVYGNPMRLSEMPPEIKRIAPGLGEHNDYVLQELLGYSEQEVTELVKEQVIYETGERFIVSPSPYTFASM
jgi:crotonobetainyl-CoA:carnitine CoA-transferase CaiB-like acyl-CoA transferase